jgi:hypothetical protein
VALILYLRNFVGLGGVKKMDITIVPLTVNSNDESKLLPIRDEKEQLIAPIVYWGVYLDDECVSYTSSRELAEKTKLWMENLLSDKH